MIDTHRIKKNWGKIISLLVGTLLTTLPLSNLASASDKPRVASINSCTDQMVLTLADPEQIVSLTYLSHDKAASIHREKALSYPTNTGTAEEILALEPDLVLASSYTSKYTIQLLQKAGVRVETLTIASSIEAVMDNITLAGEWLEQSDAAASIVSDMKTRLDAVASAPKTEPSTQPNSERNTQPNYQPNTQPRAAIYDPNGYTVGNSTLRGQALELSGWHNVATDRGVEYYGTLALESLLKLNPDILVASPYSANTWSRGQALNSHPALAQSGIQADVINIPSAKTICGGPWSVGVIEQLARVRLKY